MLVASVVIDHHINPLKASRMIVNQVIWITEDWLLRLLSNLLEDRVFVHSSYPVFSIVFNLLLKKLRLNVSCI